MPNCNKLCAEALGTFTLVLVGSLAIVSSGEGGALVIGLGFGLALLMALHLFGAASGGHFNPAVSLAAFLDKRIGLPDMVGYWIAQAVGAIVASAVVLALFDTDTVAGTATTVSGEVWVALVAEIVLTALFVAVILRVTAGGAAGGAFMTIALTLVAIHLAGLGISGASVNPARTLGPALVGETWGNFWLYLVGPAVGGIAGWALHRMAACKSCCKS